MRAHSVRAAADWARRWFNEHGHWFYDGPGEDPDCEGMLARALMDYELQRNASEPRED